MVHFAHPAPPHSPQGPHTNSGDEPFPGERFLVLSAALCLLTVSITLVICICSPKCYLHKKCSKKSRDEEEYLTKNGHDNSTGTFSSFFTDSPIVGQWKSSKNLANKEFQPIRRRSTYSIASSSSTDLLADPKVGVELNAKWDEKARTCTLELIQMTQQDLPRKYRDTMMTLTAAVILTKDTFRKSVTKLQEASTGYIARQNAPTTLDKKIITQLPSTSSKTLLTFDVCQTAFVVKDFPIWSASVPLQPILSGDVDLCVPLSFPEPVRRAGVVVSACYMPVAEKLSISLLECQGLDATVRDSLEKTPEFYIKVSLARHGKMLTKRKIKAREVKSIVMLNDTFTFDVPRAHVDQIRIIVTVLFLGQMNGQLVEERLGKATFASEYHSLWHMVLKQTRRPQIMHQDIL